MEFCAREKSKLKQNFRQPALELVYDPTCTRNFLANARGLLVQDF